MSNHERGVLDCLAGQDMKLLNLKCFRGSDDLIEPDAMKAELCASVERTRSGAIQRSATPPKCVKAPVDVRDLVADM